MHQVQKLGDNASRFNAQALIGLEQAAAILLIVSLILGGIALPYL